jgi:hypothetical protein
VALGSGTGLTLEFDLMQAKPRPLQVHFIHADRAWRRDAAPSQFLDGFANDNLLDYAPSRGTDVPYVHYRYLLPNQSVRFRVSGNYILRVTQRGRYDDVLFELPFFVSEEAGPMDVSLQRLVVSGQQRASELPVVQFRPPSSLQADVFRFEACYVRNARFDEPRCTSRSRLAQPPTLRFELDRREAFAPAPAHYVLDLGRLQVGGQIERVDRTVAPPQVLLEPDYARFSGGPLDPRLGGQILIEGAVQDAFDPDVTAQYVTTRFAFVPENETPLDASLLLGGSFSRWRFDPAQRMAWIAERGRYEGEVLLKQGQYEYFYRSRDPRLARTFDESMPRAENVYTALVYYRDLRLNTDRLLAAETVRTR